MEFELSVTSGFFLCVFWICLAKIYISEYWKGESWRHRRAVWGLQTACMMLEKE